MIASLLALLAAASIANAEELGSSPLVEEGHTHRWVEFARDQEGAGWLDEAWRSQVEVDGRRFVLVLIRSDIAPPNAMIADFVLAVDCERRMTGMKQVWLFKSDYGDGVGREVPVELSPVGSPPDKEDQQILAYACKAGSGRR